MGVLFEFDLGLGCWIFMIEHQSVTYFGCEAVLRIPSERLRRPLAVPLEQGRSHGGLWPRQDGEDGMAALKNKTPTASRWGFSFLGAWQ